MKFTILDAVDILIVAFIIYKLINLIRGTRAITLIKGLAVIVIGGLAAKVLSLRTVNWILEQGTTAFFVALPIVFYPELRRALERIGQGSLFNRFSLAAKSDIDNVIDILVKAAGSLSARRVGTLIAIEREIGLQEFVETGILVDALLSEQLLVNIFEPNSPLHDGAVIIIDNRIQAAACVLPLTEFKIDLNLGTRHKAAIGLSEQSDALVVVVSEETGVISLAVGGRLFRYLTGSRLREHLQVYLSKEEQRIGLRRTRQ